MNGSEASLRVMSLHALAYCERLFYLEEVEEIRVADARVYAGRTLHQELEKEEADGPTQRFVLESEALGLHGEVDALRRRDAHWIPYEHKRGRSRREGDEQPSAWPSDRLQIGAYAMLLEEATGEVVPEARLRYHADNVTVRIPIDDALRADVRSAIARASRPNEGFGICTRSFRKHDEDLVPSRRARTTRARESFVCDGGTESCPPGVFAEAKTRAGFGPPIPPGSDWDRAWN